MSKIACIITDYFEDSEYIDPVKAFKEAGHQIIPIGLKAGVTVKGKKHDTPVHIEKDINEISPDDFDALFIPGGFSPDQLRAHDKAVHFAKDFMESDKPVFAICHGPQLLITADKLRGRKVTGWKSISQDIINAGANFQDSEVVVDGKLVTSRKPDDIPAFVRESLKFLS